MVEHAAEAVIVTDIAGRVLAANAAFGSLVQRAVSGGVEGQPLADLLPEAGPRLLGLIADARRHGIAARAVLARPGEASLEVSAMLLPEGDQERVGLSLRPMAASDAVPLGAASALADAIVHLGHQIGQRALPQLMREATALAERHLIDTALLRHGPALAAVAAALGLSQDNLELRMRRLGLLPGEDGAPVAVR